MPSSFYVASSREQLALVRNISALLEVRGLRNLFPWWEHFDHKCGEHCGIADRKSLAAHELLAASQCDLFIGVARLGKGSHVELGAALTGSPKKIVLIGVTPSDLVFYDAEGVMHISMTELDLPRHSAAWAAP